MSQPAGRTLLLDNYDSYTFNLFQIIAEANGVEPLVFTNDAIDIQTINSLINSGEVNNIVISPGPGTPERAQDIGVCLDVLQQLPDVPVLGVCLGHQAMALVHGGRVVKAPEPVHGRISELQHNGHPLFAGIPSGVGGGFEVVRYHSLLVDHKSMPDTLEPIAWTCGRATHAANPGQSGHNGHALQQQEQALHTPGRPSSNSVDDGSLLMGLAVRGRPHFGVQFHPESICTLYGIAVLHNFVALSCMHLKMSPPRTLGCGGRGPPGEAMAPHAWPSKEHQHATLGLTWQRATGLLTHAGGSQHIFEALFRWADHTFWLDRWVLQELSPPTSV